MDPTTPLAPRSRLRIVLFVAGDIGRLEPHVMMVTDELTVAIRTFNTYLVAAVACGTVGHEPNIYRLEVETADKAGWRFIGECRYGGVR